MSLTAKRWITSFWRTAVFTCSCWLTFFLFRCGFQEKREPSWKNYLIWTADWCGVHSTPDPQKALIIFLSVISKMQVIFWSEDNFCFISDCRNAFYCKLKKLINEQIIIFYSPSNALCSPETFTKKNSLRNLTRFYGVEDLWNFDNSFFAKNYYLALNFFQVLQSALLKNCLTLQETEEKHWKNKNKNKKWEKVKQQQ